MPLPETFGLFEDDLLEQRLGAESVLGGLLGRVSVRPPAALKQKLLGRLGFSGDSLDLKNLPVTDRFANHLSWLQAIAPLLPKEPVEAIYMKELRRDQKIVQTLVVSAVDVPEEVHEDYAESFFILQGRCACTIGTEVFELGPGDYLDIPLHIPHDIHLVTPEVTAILQYQLC